MGSLGIFIELTLQAPTGPGYLFSF